jgi:hypothetical protein
MSRFEFSTAIAQAALSANDLAGCSSQELTESRENFPEIHAPFLLTPLITNHADNLV